MTVREPTGSGELLEVAVEHATHHVPMAAPGQSASSVRRSLVGREYECAAEIAVMDGRALVGLVGIERLLDAAENVTMAELMEANPPAVAPGADQEVAAWEMARRGESSVAVVDDEGRFVGLIPPARMVSVLLHEHDEDLARLGGYVRGTRRARDAAEERVTRRLLHRLPWLLLGLVGAMASALIIGAFEEQLDDMVLLAFFVPAVVYIADAVGTQTEALLIRGLAVRVAIGKVVRRELVTGVIMGVIMGAAFVPFVLAGWGDADVALAVGLALFASCSIATIVAMALPLAFQRLGADPAFGSGPLATVIQDLLSIVVYLGIAIPIAT